jgi:hypothetical protein
VEPCANHNNDVFVSVSNNGGATWGPTRLVSKGPNGKSQPAAQWQHWGDVGEGGQNARHDNDNGALFVAYYDRQFGGCESSGCNDITLAKSTNNGSSWTFRRISTSSMPNLTHVNHPFESGFLGDYMSIQAANNRVVPDLGRHPRPGRDRGRGRLLRHRAPVATGMRARKG